jgi:hypothetical protein
MHLCRLLWEIRRELVGAIPPDFRHQSFTIRKQVRMNDCRAIDSNDLQVGAGANLVECRTTESRAPVKSHPSDFIS